MPQLAVAAPLETEAYRRRHEAERVQLRFWRKWNLHHRSLVFQSLRHQCTNFGYYPLHLLLHLFLHHQVPVLVPLTPLLLPRRLRPLALQALRQPFAG